MATLSTVHEQTLPDPGTIYPDTIDECTFKYIREHIDSLEASNHLDVDYRISAGCLKKVFSTSGLYTEGVPIEYLDIILDSIDELAVEDNQLNCMLWLVQQSALRVYIQSRNRISSGKQHIGNVWIVDTEGGVHLFIIKSQ